MKKIVLSICAAAMLLLPVMASAETEDYDWSFSAGSSAIVGSGNLTVDLDVTGTGPDDSLGYQIISLSGTVNGVSVSLVPTACTSPCTDLGVTVPGVDYDNLLFDPAAGSPPSNVDVNGIDFVDSNGTNYNIYSEPPDELGIGTTAGDNTIIYEDLDGAGFMVTPVSGTPEPASILLIAGGIAGIGFIRRRRLA